MAVAAAKQQPAQRDALPGRPESRVAQLAAQQWTGQAPMAPLRREAEAERGEAGRDTAGRNSPDQSAFSTGGRLPLSQPAAPVSRYDRRRRRSDDGRGGAPAPRRTAKPCAAPLPRRLRLCYEAADAGAPRRALRQRQGSRKEHVGTAFTIRLRGPAGLRPRRIVRSRQRATAAAADADVRPHRRHQRGWRRARQGRRARRVRHQARALVFLLSFQRRSRHAGLPRARRAVAVDRLFPRLARPARAAAGRSGSAK